VARGSTPGEDAGSTASGAPAAEPAAARGRPPLPVSSRRHLAASRAQENFPIAAWALRPGLRSERAALYGFCRTVDDLGDDQAGDRTALLEAFRGELRRCWGGRPDHPVLRHLQPVIVRHRLDPDPFERLVAANLQDQVVQRYRDWDELVAYCTRSATPVGELVLALEGIRDRRRVGLSDAVCTGLQLANMWQDIAADRARGRRYLPLAVLTAAGAREDDWWRGDPMPPLRAAMAAAVARARHELRAGWPLVGAVTGLLRVEMATFIRSGLAACAAVEAAGDRVFTEKARIPAGARRRAVMGALPALWRPGRRPR